MTCLDTYLSLVHCRLDLIEARVLSLPLPSKAETTGEKKKSLDAPQRGDYLGGRRYEWKRETNDSALIGE